MSTPQEKLEAMLKNFEVRTKTDLNHPAKNLRDLLEHSPDLKARFLDSVGKGHLERFDLLPAGAHAGGTYNSGTKSMELPQSFLDSAGTSTASKAELVFVMGHEIQHSFNSTVTSDATTKFTQQVDKVAKGPGPHDYTTAIDNLIRTNRRDEASANLGGFNALASQMQKDHPKATLEDLYESTHFRMQDFIDRSGTKPNFTYALKPDLTFDKDKDGKTLMHLTASKENVEAMGKHYFDKALAAPNGLGPKGNQDYHNYYGNWALNQINVAEKAAQATHKSDPKYVPPKVEVDLHKVGLDKGQLDTHLKYADTSPVIKKPVIPGAHVSEHDVAVPAAQASKGPFGDPLLDQAFLAMQKGQDAQLNASAQHLQSSPEGQKLLQTGTDLLAQQQSQEQAAPTQSMPAQSR
ncbi:MAG: hypothetical protein ACMG50_03815 [Thermomonas sp.]